MERGVNLVPEKDSAPLQRTSSSKIPRTAFDWKHLISLHYETTTSAIEGIKEGILLEAGFDTVTPTQSISISHGHMINISCYHPGYTFVEKLQTITTKFRQEQEDGTQSPTICGNTMTYTACWSIRKYLTL